MFVYFNPNPDKRLVGDCVVRAICKLTDQDWDTTYLEVCACGLMLHNMPSGNDVWDKCLRLKGFTRTALPDTCPDCYTVSDFCEEHPKGKYVLAIGTHVVAVDNGDYYDTWDSGNEIPIFYWRKEQ